MRILIDADGCPVTHLAAAAARKQNTRCLILCDWAHRIDLPGTETLTLPKGPDSVDFALANLAEKGDIVVTQDYGLAAMCLSRGARVLNQDGMEYTARNIDALLIARHTARKIRSAGGRLKGPARRTKEQDREFERKLSEMMEKEAT